MDFKIYQHIIIRFKLWLGGSWLDLWKSCLRSVSLFPLYLYSNVKLALLSIATPLYRVAHSSSSSVCPAILQMTLLPNKLSFLPLPSVPSVTFPPSLPSPHTAPASLLLSVPSPNVTTLPPPPSPLLFSPSLAWWMASLQGKCWFSSLCLISAGCY